jgi:hypothetical protein
VVVVAAVALMNEPKSIAYSSSHDVTKTTTTTTTTTITFAWKPVDCDGANALLKLKVSMGCA